MKDSLNTDVAYLLQENKDAKTAVFAVIEALASWVVRVAELEARIEILEARPYTPYTLDF